MTGTGGCQQSKTHLQAAQETTQANVRGHMIPLHAIPGGYFHKLVLSNKWNASWMLVHAQITCTAM